MSDGKLEFGSHEWMVALRDVIAGCVSEAGGAANVRPFSISEEYTDAPAGLGGSAPYGWTARISAAGVDFAFEPAADVEVHITGRYAALLPIAQFVVGDDPQRGAEMASLQAEAGRRGDIRATGDLRKSPSYMAPVHDLIAIRTR